MAEEQGRHRFVRSVMEGPSFNQESEIGNEETEIYRPERKRHRFV